ncbi:MAG TPA: hypothetical protein PK231_07595 [Acidocella sp.]|nr:hypothetical protein [Acidocella sp.]
MFKQASFPWLLAHEIKLLWRGSILLRTSKYVLVPVIAVSVIFQAIALLIVKYLQTQTLSPPILILIANINLIFLSGLMLSRAMTSAIDVLYSRGDADFLLASPIKPIRILAVRMIGVAASVAAPWLLLAAALANALALFGNLQALAAYIIIPTLAALVTALAFLSVVSLVARTGPAKARLFAHSIALFIGLFIFALGQAPRYIAPQNLRALWLAFMPNASNINAAIWFPARALLGEFIPAVLFCVVCAFIFWLVLLTRARQFADGTISAAAYGSGPARRRGGGTFRQHPFAATMLKNLRLLLRFPGLVTQTIYRSLTLVPVTMILTGRVAIGTGPSIVLPLLVFLAGQLALFFISIIMGSEQSPDLLASAPVSPKTGRRAAYAAAAYACAIIMAVPVIGVLWREGQLLWVLLPAMGGSIICNLLLGQRFPIPLLRPAFGKTQTGTVFGLILGVSASSLWAFIAWLAVTPHPFAML